MKKIISFALFGVLSTTIPVGAVTSRVGSAQDLGVGIQLGQPMGLTGKYWLSSTSAIDAAAGYHFNSNFDIHTDYLWHSFSSFDVQNGRLPFYFGMGGRILAGDDTQFGMRIPFGFSYLPSSEPYEFFAEMGPIIKLAPGIGADVDGAVGIRIYLNYVK